MFPKRSPRSKGTVKNFPESLEDKKVLKERQMPEYRSISELTSITDDLVKVFRDNEDFERLEGIKEKFGHILGAYSTKGDDAREYLKKMNQLVVSEESLLLEYENEVAADSAMENLQKEAEYIEKELEEIKQEENICTEELAKLQERAEESKRKLVKELRDLEKVQLPLLKYAISLYANISRIKWDYRKSEEGKELAGYIAVPETADVRAFSIDRTAKNDFEVAETLWDMILRN